MDCHKRPCYKYEEQQVNIKYGASKSEILKAAEKEGNLWIESATFDGKSNLPIIKSELEQIEFEGKPVKAYVTNDLHGVIPLIIQAAMDECGGNIEKGKKLLKTLTPQHCIWDYYLMAFYECAYHRLPIESQDIEFMNHSLLDAFKAGLGFVINFGDVLIGLTRPEAYRDDRNRIHNADGPAIIWGQEEQYWWHNSRIPDKWIKNPNACTVEDFKAISNMESKRAFCEILGWERIIDLVGFEKIQSDDWGTLVRTQLDDDNGKPALFADVTCPSTRRRYLLRTDPEIKTCHEAIARSFNIDVSSCWFNIQV